MSFSGLARLLELAERTGTLDILPGEIGVILENVGERFAMLIHLPYVADSKAAAREHGFCASRLCTACDPLRMGYQAFSSVMAGATVAAAAIFAADASPQLSRARGSP
jgi:hypothetical protein